MTARTLQILYVLLVLALISGCDKGLTPPIASTRATVHGAVRFKGNWPLVDSNWIIAVALVPEHEPFKDSDLIKGVLAGTIVTQTLHFHSKDTTYKFDLDPKPYYYLGIAQQFGTNLFKDFKVVGFAHDAKDSALAFDLKQGSDITADILVNWDSLPRQPFLP